MLTDVIATGRVHAVPEFISLSEAMKISRKSRSTLLRDVCTGRVTSVYSGRNVKISVLDLDSSATCTSLPILAAGEIDYLTVTSVCNALHIGHKVEDLVRSLPSLTPADFVKSNRGRLIKVRDLDAALVLLKPKPELKPEPKPEPKPSVFVGAITSHGTVVSGSQSEGWVVRCPADKHDRKLSNLSTRTFKFCAFCRAEEKEKEKEKEAAAEIKRISDLVLANPVDDYSSRRGDRHWTRTRSQQGPTRKLPEGHEPLVLKLYEAGALVADLAKIYEMTPSAIYIVIKKARARGLAL